MNKLLKFNLMLSSLLSIIYFLLTKFEFFKVGDCFLLVIIIIMAQGFCLKGTKFLIIKYKFNIHSKLKYIARIFDIAVIITILASVFFEDFIITGFYTQKAFTSPYFYLILFFTLTLLYFQFYFIMDNLLTQKVINDLKNNLKENIKEAVIEEEIKQTNNLFFDNVDLTDEEKSQMGKK